MDVLDELSIEPAGSVPGGLQLTHDERGLHRLPVDARSLLRTSYLSSMDKAAFGSWFARIGRISAEEYDGVSVNEMIEAFTSRPRVAGLFRALSRLTSYTADLDVASGGATLRQLQMGAADNVFYLDGGWQQLVDAMLARCKGQPHRCAIWP